MTGTLVPWETTANDASGAEPRRARAAVSFASPEQALLTARLHGFLDALGPAGLTAALGRVASLVAHQVGAVVRNAFRELEQWQTTLRAMANQLGQLELRSKRAVVREMGIEPGAVPLRPEHPDQ